MKLLPRRGTSFAEHMGGVAEQFRLEAQLAATEAERERLLRKARCAEIAADIDQWLCSPGLQVPS